MRLGRVLLTSLANPKRAFPMPVPSFSSVGTHSGTFHCDEAMAVALLSLVHPDATGVPNSTATKSAPLPFRLVRSRDEAVLSDCDVVVDVGGVYDPAALRFDHHQRGFAETLGMGFETKLSSSGLVFKHFGREAIAAAAGGAPSDADVDAVFRKMYAAFMEDARRG